MSPYTYWEESRFSNNAIQTIQDEIPYTTSGLQIRFLNPNDKKYIISVNGVYTNSNQSTNQGLSFQINNKTDGLTIGTLRYSYFYLRWSYNHLNTFLDSTTAVTGAELSTQFNTVRRNGLELNDGFIDISVTLI